MYRCAKRRRFVSCPWASKKVAASLPLTSQQCCLANIAPCLAFRPRNGAASRYCCLSRFGVTRVLLSQTLPRRWRFGRAHVAEPHTLPRFLRSGRANVVASQTLTPVSRFGVASIAASQRLPHLLRFGRANVAASQTLTRLSRFGVASIAESHRLPRLSRFGLAKTLGRCLPFGPPYRRASHVVSWLSL